MRALLQPIDAATAEHCWVDLAQLCLDCWEEFGVCTTLYCCALRAELVKAKTPRERAEIMNRPGPIGATKSRRPEH